MNVVAKFLLAVALVFMCFAAFKLDWGSDTVVWFYLSLAAVIAAVLADWVLVDGVGTRRGAHSGR